MKQIESCEVLSIKEISKDIFDIRVKADQVVRDAKPGQFVTLYTEDPSKLLPRPMSICGLDKENGILRMVFRISGKGTAGFAALKEGGHIRVMGPHGNGFPLEAAAGKKAAVIGGGIGIPPMLETAKSLGNAAKVTAVLGYRDELYLNDEFEKASSAVIISTEDGSAGTKGNVLDAMKANGYKPDIIYACGPKPMLRALKQYAIDENIECWLSMEERMACGIGACLACVCNSTEKDEHSNVNNKRVCKDGPVFNALEIEL